MTILKTEHYLNKKQNTILKTEQKILLSHYFIIGTIKAVIILTLLNSVIRNDSIVDQNLLGRFDNVT